VQFLVTDWGIQAYFSAVPTRMINGLILEQCEEGKARFRRLGVFTFEEDQCFEHLLKDCLDFEGQEG